MERQGLPEPQKVAREELKEHYTSVSYDHKSEVALQEDAAAVKRVAEDPNDSRVHFMRTRVHIDYNQHGYHL